MELKDAQEHAVHLLGVAAGWGRCDLARRTERIHRGLILRHLRDRLAVAEDRADWGGEPAVDGDAHHVRRHEEQETHR